MACYRVQITKTVPLNLVPIIGYKGDAALSGGGNGQNVIAVALAITKTETAPFCLMALSGGIVAHGVPFADLTCNIYSNTSADCTGHDLTSGYSDTTGNGKNSCG